MESKFIGKVKWFNKEKGYGFINRIDDETDIFVHFSQIQMKGYKELSQGDEVSFLMIETNNGFQAQKVAIIKKNIPNYVSIKKMAN